MRRTVLLAFCFGAAACSTSKSDVAGSDAAPPSPDAAIAPDAPPIVHSTTPIIPEPTGTCPTIANGDVTFAPAGIPPRKVKIAMKPSASTDHGQLVFYWFATGSSPNEAAYSLGATETAIVNAGGIVAAPYADPTAGQFEWFVVNQSSKGDDFIVADEVVACLAKAHLIDPTHVHSMGMSAGALQTTALSFFRSAWVASVATYSGGMPDGFAVPPMQDPDNKFAALIFDGGTSDNVFGVDFKVASENYASALTAAGHYAELCDHGGGHAIPLDAAPSVALFFTANGFGAWPSPYASGIPQSFPTYCAR